MVCVELAEMEREKIDNTNTIQKLATRAKQSSSWPTQSLRVAAEFEAPSSQW